MVKKMAACNDCNHNVEVNTIPLTKLSSIHPSKLATRSAAQKACPQMSQETDIGRGTENGEWSFRSPKVGGEYPKAC